MDLTFQVPMQYCSLLHWTLLSPPDISTKRCCFYFDSVSSFFLELFLCSSVVAYWAPTDLGSSSFSVTSFCFFMLFMEFSRQECWGGLPFPSPVDHVLSEFSTTIPLWTELNQEPWWRTIPPLPVKFSFLFSPEISIIATTSLSTWMYLKWIRVSSLTTGLPFQPLCYWSSTFLKTRLSSSSSFCMTSLSHAHHFLYYILWKLHHDI